MHLAQRTHPELSYLQTRRAGAMSYERAAKLLGQTEQFPQRQDDQRLCRIKAGGPWKGDAI